MGKSIVRGSFNVGGPPPDKAGDVGQHVGEQHVVAAEDIALADPASLQRGEMAGGDVIDISEIEPRVDEGRHATRGGFDDDAAGRGGLDVARADRRRRVDDHRRQPIPARHRFNQTLGRDLAALVGANPLAFGRGASSVAAPRSVSFRVATLLV